MVKSVPTEPSVGMLAVERAQVDRHQPGLPVVGVDDLRAASVFLRVAIASSPPRQKKMKRSQLSQ